MERMTSSADRSGRGLRLSLVGYWALSRTVLGLADRLCEGRVVAVLEGGYNLAVLASGVANLCRALLGDTAPGPDPLGRSPRPERPADDVIRSISQLHSLGGAS
jgi:acetoin utilization deacetylase AcuC-like enzyme